MVERPFHADGPNEICVSDFTYVATWSGFVYVAFIIDVYSRFIVGWRAASSMTSGEVGHVIAGSVEQCAVARVARVRACDERQPLEQMQRAVVAAGWGAMDLASNS